MILGKRILTSEGFPHFSLCVRIFQRTHTRTKKYELNECPWAAAVAAAAVAAAAAAAAVAPVLKICFPLFLINGQISMNKNKPERTNRNPPSLKTAFCLCFLWYSCFVINNMDQVISRIQKSMASNISKIYSGMCVILLSLVFAVHHYWTWSLNKPAVKDKAHKSPCERWHERLFNKSFKWHKWLRLQSVWGVNRFSWTESMTLITMRSNWFWRL